MYNWVTRRNLPRTEGSSYPTRAAQTVDAVVAKWIPIAVALLACAVTPARPKLDVRTYDWQPAFTWVRSVVDGTVRTYLPAATTELQSYRVGSQGRRDVRFSDWTADEGNWISATQTPALTVAQTWPAFQQSGLSARTPEGPRLDARRYEWDPPETAWIAPTQLVAATVAQTAPAWANHSTQYRTANGPPLDLARTSGPTFFRTPEDWVYWTPQQDEGGLTRDRARLNVRGYEWVPEAFDVVTRVDTAVRTWIPAFAAELASTRTAAAPVLDVRRSDWAAPSSSWSTAPVTAAIAPWSPIFADALAGTRTTAAPVLDVRTPQWTTQTDWIAAPVTSTLTQQWPAVLESTGPSYRTPDGVKIDVRRYEWQPSAFGLQAVVDATVASWASVLGSELAGTRTGSAPVLDVRRYEWTPESFDLVARVDAQVKTWAQVFRAELAGARTNAAPSLDVRGPQWASDSSPWFTATQTVAATIAQTAPAWTRQGQGFRTAAGQTIDLTRIASAPNFFRTPENWVFWTAFQDHGELTRARARLDVRRFEWAPESFDIVTRVDGQVRAWIPIFDAELASRRTDAGPRLDVRGYEWAVDDSAWIRATQTPALTVAQTWPAFQHVGPRTVEGARLDVRRYEWGAWTITFQPTVEQTWPAFQETTLSARTLDRARLDTRRYEWSVDEAAWVYATQSQAPSIAQTAPAWTIQTHALTHRPAPVRTWDQPAWIAASVVLEVQRWPAIRDAIGSWRTPACSALDVRSYDWAPASSWGASVVDASVARLVPIFHAALASVRTSDAPRLDVRGSGWTPDTEWILVTYAATPAQIWPALLQNLGTQDRTHRAATLDTRFYGWAPFATAPASGAFVDDVIFTLELYATASLSNDEGLAMAGVSGELYAAASLSNEALAIADGNGETYTTIVIEDEDYLGQG